MLNGSFGGFVGILVGCPQEMLKTQAVQNKAKGFTYFDVFRNLEKKRLVYRGFLPLIYRDVPGMAFYFMTYEEGKRKLLNDQQSSFT